MRPSRLVATIAGFAAAAVLWQSGLAFAQAQGASPATPPTASPPATTPPAASPTPATPPAATPPAASPPAAATPPPAAQTPAASPPAAQAPAASPPAAAAPATPPPAASAPAPSGDTFGQDVTLTAKTIVYASGKASWDRAFEAIQDSLKTVNAYLQKQNIKPIGPAMTIYTATDDNGFSFRVGVPVAEAPNPAPTGNLAVGQSPAGNALKYVHRGSYDAMDATYEAITNQLDDKNLEAQDLFIEVYVTDPLTTPDDKLVIEVYVPLR